MQAIVFQAFAMVCDVMHDYKWLYNPDAASGQEKGSLLRKQASFNFIYLFIEATSLTGAYFIFLYKNMLAEEYKYTNWNWKFIIFIILLLLINW